MPQKCQNLRQLSEVFCKLFDTQHMGLGITPYDPRVILMIEIVLGDDCYDKSCDPMVGKLNLLCW